MPRRPSSTPRGREEQLIAKAVDLAERQLDEGTISASALTQLLRMASPRERLEREKLEMENKHLQAKIESLESNRRIEELYTEAMRAFRIYHGDESDEVEDVY